VKDLTQELQELADKGIQPSNSAYKDAEAKLKEALVYQKDVHDHPSKYSFMKAMRGARIFGKMTPLNQKNQKPVMELMLHQYQADLKMDQLHGRAGAQTRLIDMYDENGVKHSVPFPKSQIFEGSSLEGFLTKPVSEGGMGYTQDPKEAEKWFDPSNKEATQSKIDEYTSKLARLEALGGLDAMTAATATPEQRKMFAGFESAVDAQSHYKRELGRYQQYLNINDKYDRKFIKNFAQERDWSYRKALDFFASLTEEAI
jgi:hypothetical protein